MHHIEIKPVGNLGNRMIQYAVADNLRHFLEPCDISGVNLAEWDIFGTEPPTRAFDKEIVLTDFNISSFQEILDQAKQANSTKITLSGVFQRLDLMPSNDYASNIIFPKRPPKNCQFGPQHLVINIRAGDILKGVPWYPFVPVEFYQWLVNKTGLTPIFIGQLHPSAYATALREAFPNAEFMNSISPMEDFSIIRSAENICIAVSTFSWMAAWLSQAKQIFFPVLGFLNPALSDCYGPHVAPANLVPTDDVRYRFFMFPLVYGLPERAMLLHHRRISGSWTEISGRQMRWIIDNAPFVKDRVGRALVDSRWYSHEYTAAALEIAYGWFANPRQHYIEIGLLRGYSASQKYISRHENVALRKPATQSSVSPYSLGSTAELDAGGAVDGDNMKELGFHTDAEPKPWWLVDLEAIYEIDCINIFNRKSTQKIMSRAIPMVVEVSADGQAFQEISRCESLDELESGIGAEMPFQIFGNAPPLQIRYLRIVVQASDNQRTFLHLAQVEIFGFEVAAL